MAANKLSQISFSNSPHKPPCKNCERRKFGCRSTCVEWFEYEKNKEIEYAEKSKKFNISLRRKG